MTTMKMMIQLRGVARAITPPHRHLRRCYCSILNHHYYYYYYYDTSTTIVDDSCNHLLDQTTFINTIGTVNNNLYHHHYYYNNNNNDSWNPTKYQYRSYNNSINNFFVHHQLRFYSDSTSSSSSSSSSSSFRGDNNDDETVPPPSPTASSSTTVSSSSTSSSSTSSTTIPSSSLSSKLDTWYSITKNIPIHTILPIGFGNIHELSNHNAYFGDKMLNLYIALLLRNQQQQQESTTSSTTGSTTTTESSTTECCTDVIESQQQISQSTISTTLPSVGTVTQLQGISMSNELLASCILQILPYHMTTIEYGNIYNTYIRSNSQIHDAGTMIEAAVDYIVHHDSSLSQETIDKAMNELAQYLIDQAQQKYTTLKVLSENPNNDNKKSELIHPTTFVLQNPKSDLLNHGGTMTCQRLEGYPDHMPQFTATAQIDDLSTTVEHGRNKRETEQSAASILWRYYSKYCLKSSKKKQKKAKQQQQHTTTTTLTLTSTNNHETQQEEIDDNNDDDDNDDDNNSSSDHEMIENPKGKIISIGGKVTSNKLLGYPDHLPRFRAICEKPFFIVNPAAQQDDDDNDVTENTRAPILQYKIAATAEGRTKYEAERIASTMIWLHVINMTTLPSQSSTTFSSSTATPSTKLIPYVTNDIPTGLSTATTTDTTTNSNISDTSEEWFDDMNENDPMFDEADPQVPEPIQPKLSAKQRRRLRTLKNATERHISQFDIQYTQDNFLQYQLTDHERPHINLRPGGETVIESWYRGALNPMAAFHRALIAPHVFPNHIGTVNAYTRHNILDVITNENYNINDDDDDDDDDENHPATNDNDNEEVFIDHQKQHPNEWIKDTDSIPTLQSEEDNGDTVTLSPQITAKAEEAGTVSSSSKESVVIPNPFDDPNLDIATRRDKKYKRTFTVLAFVVPNLHHPLVATMKSVSEYNMNELLTKCFVEHGYNVRDTRNAIGIKINQYIIDVLLKNYENLDEIIEKERQRREQELKDREGMTRKERKTIFFKF